MVHSPVARRRSRWLWSGLGALVALSLCVVFLRAQQPRYLHEALITAGDKQAISLFADDISTWEDGGQRAFLLKGNVSVGQGSTLMKMTQGVVWIDEGQRKSTGVYTILVYGEGKLHLEKQTQVDADFGYVHLATAGEINITAYGQAVAQANRAEDAVFRRASSNRPPGLPDAAPVEQTAGPAPGAVQQAVFTAPAGAAQPIQRVAATQFPPPDGNQADIGPPPDGSPQATPTPLPRRTAPTQGAASDVAPPTTPGDPRLEKEVDPPSPSTPLPLPPGLPAGPGAERQFVLRPRTSLPLQLNSYPQANGETAVVVSGGVIIRIFAPRAAPPPGAVDKDGKPVQVREKANLVDIEADRLVFWTSGNGQQAVNTLSSADGHSSSTFEFFLSGNVELRFQSDKKVQETLRAESVFYDATRSVAIAQKADLEIKQSKLPFPIHLQSDEILQLNAKQFKADRCVVFSAILPSDPGLRVELSDITVTEREQQRRTVFGLPFLFRDEDKQIEKDHYFDGRNMVTRLEGVPVFYFPWFKGRVEDPLGPLESFGFNYNQTIFGFQIYTAWDLYELLGIDPIPNTRWRLYLDGMTLRGPAAGTQYDFSGKSFLGYKASVDGIFKMYGIHDDGKDVIGGGQGQFILTNPTPFTGVEIEHPEWRGRVLSRTNVQGLPDGFSLQAQIGLESDRNFMRQFYLQDWYNDYNVENSLYFKQQQDSWAWSIYGNARTNYWYTQTESLPRLDGWLLGQTFFDRLVYDAHVNAGYYKLRPGDLPPVFQPTDVPSNPGRLDFWNDVSLPFNVGEFKVVPYLNGDLAYYTSDVDQQSLGRAYGGAGLRASIPFSRLFPDIKSELFNVDGIFHKITLSGNYYYARTSASMFQFPQIDRLNDDSADLTLRDIRPYQPGLNPANAVNLLNNPIFNPQIYALQRIVTNRPDTLDDIDVFQVGMRQRWQTKRGFPGNEHVVDWMVLDLNASLFPNAMTFDYANPAGTAVTPHTVPAMSLLDYDWVWNIGDRTALTSSGWMETVANGPRYFTVGGVLNRPDGSNFYLGYRQVDPLLSRAVVASIVYPISTKYAVTASTVWDFGIEQQTYSVLLTRLGTDVQVSFGFSYNSILSNFNVNFMIVPNLLRSAYRNGGGPAATGGQGFGAGGLGGSQGGGR